MNRLISKLIVFTSLLGAAGLLWGYFTADAWSTPTFISYFDRFPSNSGLVIPVVFVLIFFAVWLAGYIVLKNPWKSLANMHSFHFFTLPYLVAASIMAMFLDQGAIAGISLVIYLMCIIAGGIYQLRETARQQKLDKERGLLREKQKQGLQLLIHVGVLIAITLALSAVIPAITAGDPEFKSNYPGISIFVYWFTDSAASLNFANIFWSAICCGAIAGLWGGFIASVGLERGRDIKNVTRLYVCMGAGLLIGATVAGMTTGAQILQLVHAYDAAFEKEKLLIGSLCIWGVCGALVGLFPVAFLHGFTGEKFERPRRLLTGFAWSLIPIMIAANWAVGYVKAKDLGRELFEKASRAEDNSAIIGMGIYSRSDEPNPTRRRSDLVIRIAEGGPVQSRQYSPYSKTIEVCNKLIHSYPESAYRSAAIFLKSYLASQNWRPEESLDANAQLMREFPKQAYDRSLVNAGTIRNNLLIGNYEAAFEAYRSRKANAEPDRGAIYAAEVLGKWDDVISLCQEKISYLQKDLPDDNKSKKEIIARYEKRIENAEEKKSRGAGPEPRTDVSGRIMITGKPARGVTVCILPVYVEAKDAITNSLMAAGLGGRTGVTDNEGYYEVAAVPSGKYELEIILDANRFKSLRYNVEAKGIPFNVTGKTAVMPTVSLSPK